MVETEYVILQLNAKLQADGIELENMPIPVRADRVDRIVGKDEIHLDCLLDELFEFLLEHKDQAPPYADFVAKLAYIVAMDMARLRLIEAAEHYLAIGLKLNPDSLSLRVNHAVALHAMNCHAEALAEYEHVLADESVGPSAFVKILAARCCKELALYEKGSQLLESLIPLGMRDPEYVELAVEMAELGGIDFGQSGGIKIQDEITSMLATFRPPESKFCSRCGKPMEPGARFCARCGAKA